MTSLSVEAIDGETECYGEKVSTLQSGIDVTDTEITGTLKHKTGYKTFSSDPEEQDGNFLALSFTAADGVSIQTELVNGTKGPVDVTDGYCVYRITDNETQMITVTAFKGKSVEKREYHLNGLTCEE